MKRIQNWLVAFVVLAQFFTPVLAREMTDEERQREIQEIREEMARVQRVRAEAEAAAEKERQDAAADQDVGAIIAGYESYLNGNCTTTKSARCADVLYSVSHQYYMNSEKTFLEEQDNYGESIDRWERNPIGPEPQYPVPDFDTPLQSYLKALELYPDFRGAAEAYYMAGDLYVKLGQTDDALNMYLGLIENQPRSVRLGAARFKAADIYFSDRRDFTNALSQLEAIDPAQLNPASLEMRHFRIAEIYYNRGDFDRSTVMFGEYIDKCDGMQFPKRDLRPEALEYLAVSFSDMENGAQAALDYFDNLGGRRYEDTVTFAVGMKNYDHGQYEEAVIALSRAIEKFPFYEMAPQAQTNIINAYVIRKKNEDANQAREKLVDTYGKESVWAQQHAGNPIAVAKAEIEVKKALGSIAVYYHALAQASRNNPEEKLGWQNKALERYNQYISKYPDDKWAVYEYYYNAAGLYTTLGQFKKSADYFDFVASADLNTYPEFQQQIDTVGLSDEEQELMKQADKTSPVDISQEDASSHVIFSLDTLRKMKVAASGLEGAATYQLPETQQFLNYSVGFQQRFPNSANSPEVLLLVADVAFEGEDYTRTITECEKTIIAYGSPATDTSNVFTRATKLKADAYTQNNQFDLAAASYDTLLARTDAASEDYANYVNLAASSIFKKGEALRSANNNVAAATVFKGISTLYPTSSVGNIAWFEAAVCYEADSNWIEAANTFKELPIKFANTELDLQRKSFGRAGEGYVKGNDYIRAAEVMHLASTTVADTAFAIGSLAKSAEYYEEAGDLEKAGDMYYNAYKMFRNAENTPVALYNAGRKYEEAKLFEQAIEVYKILGAQYPEHNLSSQGIYSVGFCYEEMGESQKMADAFVHYADAFPTNRPNQIEALLRATEAYQELGMLQKAETYVSLAIDVFDRYHERDAISTSKGAKAYYIYGNLNQKKMEKIALDGNSPARVQSQLDKKVEALGPVLESYASAIQLGVEEWTFKSTYAIGMAYVNFAENLRNQRLFGSLEEQIAAKIGLVSGLEQYYVKAQDRLAWNIRKAQEDGISNESVRLSEITFMEMGYRKGRLLEEVGEIFRDAPIPGGLSEDEEMMYSDALYEKYLMSLDAALPKYEEALQHGIDLHIGNNVWVDSIKEHIMYIDPTSTMSDVDLDAEKASYAATSGVGTQTIEQQIAAQVQRELQLALANIAAIVESDMEVDEKIARLQSLEMTAKRQIDEEDVKIDEFKAVLGVQ